MVLKKLQRNATLDALDLFRRLDQVSDSDVADPARVDAVVEAIRSSLQDDLSKPSTVRGWRAQSLFASLVAALDQCDFMTFTDTGEVYAEASVKPADFFLCLKNGRRLVVDVKSHDMNVDMGIDEAIKFSASEVERLQRFADFHQAELLFAFHILPMNSWYLLDATDLTRGPGGSYRTTVGDVIKRNQMALLGDFLVGTVPPLEIRVTPDPDAPNIIDENGQADFTIGKFETYSGGKLIGTPVSVRLVWFFMQFGSWEISEEFDAEDDRLLEYRSIATPVDGYAETEGFDFVGYLSDMYSNMFNLHTSSNDSPISALDMKITPGMLATLLPHDFDYATEDLRLWRFEVGPDTEEDASGDQVIESD